MNPLKTQIQARIKLFWKIWLGLLASVALIFLSTISSDLFKGDIFQGGSTKTDNFYIPDYPASAGDVGDIQVVSTQALTNVGGFSFVLVYNPNQVTIPNNAVSADNFDFVNSNNISSGRLKVIGASGNADGITISAGSNLVTIDELTLASDLADGTEIDLTIEDFEIVSSVGGNLTSDKSKTVTAGKITIGVGVAGSLELLSANVVDNTTVRLNFSDYITNEGTFSINNGLTITNTEIDPSNGKAILLTTSTQAKGILYTITANNTTGNTDGGLSANNTAYFTGIGAITVASDFNLESAVATGTGEVALTFSDAILNGSIYKSSITLTETGNPANAPTIATAVKSSTNGKVINLTLTGATLLNPNSNYQVKFNNTGVSTDLRRASDSLILGKNTTTFVGYSSTTPTNVFGVSSVTAIATNQIKVVFSENMAADTIDVADFGLSGFAINSIEVPYDGKYNQVWITLSGSLVSGQYYTLMVNDSNGLSSYSGNNLGTDNTEVFVGYGTYADTSNLALESATADSSTKVTLTLNKAPLASTVTPVNFEIIPTLTITDAKVSDSNVVLTTAVQKAGTLYTVVAKADKIKDQNSISISSNNTTTFDGYASKTPTINSILPNQIVNNVEQTITIAGTNFEANTKVLINTLELASTIQANQITATVPASTTAGVYNLILQRPGGEQIQRENALVIEDSAQSMKVLSDESYASPQRVPNDGETETTLWVRISDPKGVSNLDKVYLDLRPLNGSPAAEMEAGKIVDTKIWYSLTITVPNTVSTSSTPIGLEVTAQNKAGDKTFGTVSVTVNNDTTSSIAPVVEQAYSTPNILKPGVDEDIYFYAYVTDEDGADSINSVIINLGPVGGAPMVMSPVDSASSSNATTNTTTTTSSSSNSSSSSSASNEEEASGNDETSFFDGIIPKFFIPKATAEFSAPTSNGRWFKTTTAFKLPSNMRNLNYNLEVTATDNTGMTGTLSFKVKTSVNTNKPFIDEDKIYVTPRESIPNDNTTTFVVYAYVEDPDGIDDIASVNLDLNEINLPPATMITTSAEGLGAWYKSAELKIPVEVIKGIKALELSAYDKSGAKGISEVQIEVTNFDEVGNAPVVNSWKNYTSPNVAINDGKTKMKFYAFVSDKDEDLDYVMINLSNVARYVGNDTASGSGSSSSSASTADNPCATTSDTILCMTPSVQEGSNWRWYVLNDVVILKEAEASTEPYRVWVTAIDKTGKSSKGFLNINVTDGTTPIEKVSTPTLKLASATSPNSIEVVISAPIDAAVLSKTGKNFKVTEKNNTSAFLGISKSVINTDGTIITLTTSAQTPGVKYSVIADADTLGLKNSKASDNTADFIGYEDSDIPPQIDTVTAISSYLVEVNFNNALKPTSITSDGSDFEIFTAEGTAQNLPIHKATIDDQYTVLVTTDAQVSNLKYRIRLKNISSAAGREVKQAGLTGLFKGYQNAVHESSELKNRADFNGDGIVDFTDFTMFSAVYGTIYSSNQSTGETEEVVEPYDPVETTSAV